jgi:hypothetical protein
MNAVQQAIENASFKTLQDQHPRIFETCTGFINDGRTAKEVEGIYKGAGAHGLLLDTIYHACCVMDRGVQS